MIEFADDQGRPGSEKQPATGQGDKLAEAVGWLEQALDTLEIDKADIFIHHAKQALTSYERSLTGDKPGLEEAVKAINEKAWDCVSDADGPGGAVNDEEFDDGVRAILTSYQPADKQSAVEEATERDLIHIIYRAVEEFGDPIEDAGARRIYHEAILHLGRLHGLGFTGTPDVEVGEFVKENKGMWT